MLFLPWQSHSDPECSCFKFFCSPKQPSLHQIRNHRPEQAEARSCQQTQTCQHVNNLVIIVKERTLSWWLHSCSDAVNKLAKTVYGKFVIVWQGVFRDLSSGPKQAKARLCWQTQTCQKVNGSVILLRSKNLPWQLHGSSQTVDIWQKQPVVCYGLSWLVSGSERRSCDKMQTCNFNLADQVL